MSLSSVRRTVTALALAVLAVPVVSTAASASQFTAPTYTITDLGSLAGGAMVASAINSSGTVVGYEQGVSGDRTMHAFVSSIEPSGTRRLQMLPTLGGAEGAAYDINDREQIVGWSSRVDGYEKNAYATLWNGTTVTNLDPPTIGQYHYASTANAVNDAAMVVGNVSGNPATYGVRWTGGKQSYGSFTRAWDVNNLNQIAGSRESIDDDTMTAVVWENDVARELAVPSEYARSAARAINDRGHVVGAAMRDGETHAHLWANDTATFLGTLGGSYSYPHAINEAGEIVGVASTSTDAYRAFLWHNSMMIDLNNQIDPTLDWTLTAANDINDAGVIVGIGTHAGQPRAFVLTPNGDPVPSGQPTVTPHRLYVPTMNKP